MISLNLNSYVFLYLSFWTLSKTRSNHNLYHHNYQTSDSIRFQIKMQIYNNLNFYTHQDIPVRYVPLHPKTFAPYLHATCSHSMTNTSNYNLKDSIYIMLYYHGEYFIRMICIKQHFEMSYFYHWMDKNNIQRYR